MSTLHISPFVEKSAKSSVAEYLKSHRGELSGIEKDFVAEAGGFKPMSGRYELEENDPFAEISVGGSLVKIKPRRPVSDGLTVVPGSLRGDVLGFSSASRRRLMRLIASLERDARPVFATLTYPDDFASENAVWKRDIDVFGKRFRREFPEAAFLWRIEFLPRKSGRQIGEIAPHFHLLVWNVRVRDLRAFASLAWYEIVGSSDIRHFNAGTNCERVYSWGGVMRYVGKYIAKVAVVPEDWTGRAWGVVGRAKMPWAIKIVIPLTDVVATKSIRLARKMMKLKGKTLVEGVTFIVNAERFLDYLEFASGFV